MAWTTTQSDGWLKNSEVVTVVASNGTYNSSALSLIGGGTIMTSVEEEAGLTGEIQYSKDDAVVGAVGGVGADPTAPATDSTQTWVGLEVAANVGDSTLETFYIPKTARKVRVQYTVVAATYGGDLGHAVDIYTDDKKSDIGFSIGGIGADPS